MGRRLRSAPHALRAHFQVTRIAFCGAVLLYVAPSDQIEFAGDRPGEPPRDLSLCLGQSSSTGLKTICPYVCSSFGSDQLHIDLHLVTRPSHATLEDIANSELATDLLRIDRFALVGEGRMPRDHKAARDSRKIGGQIIGNLVG